MSVIDWSTADPLAEIDGAIHRLEDDRNAWQHQEADAHAAMVRAQHLADAAAAQETLARRHVRDDTAELEQLLTERAAILPEQRAP